MAAQVNFFADAADEKHLFEYILCTGSVIPSCEFGKLPKWPKACIICYWDKDAGKESSV